MISTAYAAAVNLKRAREAKGLLQSELASRLCLSVRTIIRCEQANVLPRNRIVANEYRRILGLKVR